MKRHRMTRADFEALLARDIAAGHVEITGEHPPQVAYRTASQWEGVYWVYVDAPTWDDLAHTLTHGAAA